MYHSGMSSTYASISNNFYLWNFLLKEKKKTMYKNPEMESRTLKWSPPDDSVSHVWQGRETQSNFCMETGVINAFKFLL